MSRDQELWRDARTLNELGELTARWLEGTNSYLPASTPDDDGAVRPDTETGPLVPCLARANRHGYLTTFSQPGEPLTDGCGQRATVEGFCTEETASRIQDAYLGTDLVVIATPPASENPTQIPVTIDDGKAFTCAGSALDAANIRHFYGGDCPHALAALLAAWQLTVIDPRWGRTGLLWQKLDLAWS